jgi:peptidoglycan/LPS O-acetylase OafA/YrhL
MSGFNPYAPSKATMAGRTTKTAMDTEVRVWCDGGKTVVMLHGASLPHRCIKCNEPAQEPTKSRTLYWIHPALFLLLFVGGWLILLIVYYVVRKRAEVNPGLCERHKKRRTMALGIGWTLSIFGLFMIFAAIGGDTPGPALVGALLLLVAIIVGMSMGRLVYARKVTKDEIRLGGFGKEYLDSLPGYPG